VKRERERERALPFDGNVFEPMTREEKGVERKVDREERKGKRRVSSPLLRDCPWSFR
jgi:hypothetical protein